MIVLMLYQDLRVCKYVCVYHKISSIHHCGGYEYVDLYRLLTGQDIQNLKIQSL
jgi:hypothetical protein